MNKAIGFLSGKIYDRVMGIDPSTKKIVMAVVDRGAPLSIISLELQHGDINTRLLSLKNRFKHILAAYKPELVMVESPILVQNPLSTKHMSYAVGIIFGECLGMGVTIEDVAPMAWKSHFGYNTISKRERELVVKKYGETEGRKVLRKMRKEQTQDTLRKMFPEFSAQLEDDNMADALGIALYAWSVYGKHGQI